MRTIALIRSIVTGIYREDAQPNELTGKRDGQIDGVTSTFERKRNIPEQIRTDDARFWLAAIANSSDDAIIAKDLDGLVKSWNKAAEMMFGYTAREIIGQPITKIIPLDLIDEDA